MRTYLYTSLIALALGTVCVCDSPRAADAAVTNPYDKVDWKTSARYRADLHVHTLQSDGCHSVDEVVSAFHDAGFSILAITDHDMVSPNFCPLREDATRGQIDFGAFATERTPYPNPRPATFPADTTWPWSDYGAPNPADLAMLGIEGAELTCTYHVNSFFSGYGVPPSCGEASSLLSDELRDVARRGGLAVLNHPDTRQPSEWFVNLYRDHSPESFVGLELGADDRGRVDSYVTLWDQLLGEVMPSRPIWGFGTSDMHLLVRTRFAFTVFLLDELTTESVKEGMRRGQFYSVIGPRILNLSRERGQTLDGPAAYAGTYPELRSIAVDRAAGKISVDATGYDEIVWISQRPAHDSNPGASRPTSGVVHRGPVFDFANAGATLRYVRAEIVRHSEEGPIRLFVNPFGLTQP